MAYPITDIQGIGTDVAAILKSDGIRTTVGLLRIAKTPKQRLKIAVKTGAPEKNVLDWVTAADRMRVKGVGWEYSELLRVAGVRTVNELALPQSAKARGCDGGSQYQAQAGARFAVGEDGHALDRGRQETAARHPLLNPGGISRSRSCAPGPAAAGKAHRS